MTIARAENTRPTTRILTADDNSQWVVTLAMDGLHVRPWHGTKDKWLHLPINTAYSLAWVLDKGKSK